MAEYKYSVARFFVDPIRDEPINVGLVVHSSDEQYLGSKFDLRRAGPKLTLADKDTLKNFQRELDPIENQAVDWHMARFENFQVADPNFLSRIADSIGNKIQFSAPRGFASEDPDQTLEELFSRFVSVPGRIALPRVTKRTLVRDAKNALAQRGLADYVKTRPIITGEHKNYTLPLGIRHSHRTYVEALKLSGALEKDYRDMAAVGRLWQDAHRLPVNRQADLCLILRYPNGRLPEGERLLQDDGVRIFQRAPQIVEVVNFERARPWE